MSQKMANGRVADSSRALNAPPANFARFGGLIRHGAIAFFGAGLLLTGCGPGSSESPAAMDALENRLVERFTPGLHSLMVTLSHRHATLWFSGEAENWALADYMIHELEELVEEIEELHPSYDGIPIAELLSEMTTPAIERLESAVDGQDREAFAQAFDQLTVACNACHVASARAFIAIERPETPPLSNLRFRP